LCLINVRVGYPMSYRHPGEIWDEMASLAPSYAGINYGRLEQKGGLQWPCPNCDHPGTPFLHADNFTRGRGLFQGIEDVPPAELPDQDYPFLLNTGRVLQHYNVTTMYSGGLMALLNEEYAMVSPEDALELDLNHGDRVKVSSRRGEVETKIQITERVPKGMIWHPDQRRDQRCRRHHRQDRRVQGLRCQDRKTGVLGVRPPVANRLIQKAHLESAPFEYRSPVTSGNRLSAISKCY
jgi:predicted molibdopterin-dependent oxidoreductase YjgC